MIGRELCLCLLSEKIGMPGVQKGEGRGKAGEEVSDAGMISAKGFGLDDTSAYYGGRVMEEWLQLAGGTTQKGQEVSREDASIVDQHSGLEGIKVLDF